MHLQTRLDPYAQSPIIHPRLPTMLKRIDLLKVVGICKIIQDYAQVTLFPWECNRPRLISSTQSVFRAGSVLRSQAILGVNYYSACLQQQGGGQSSAAGQWRSKK